MSYFNGNYNNQQMQGGNQVVHPTVGVYRIPADTLINSPYYSMYSTCFDLIWYEDKKYSQNIYDWLIWSLDKGRKLERDANFAYQSVKSGFPYFCETEEEFDMIRKIYDPLGGTPNPAKDIIDFEYKYGFESGNMYHPEKLNYWKNALINMAESGNLEAKACIVNKIRRGGGPMFPYTDESLISLKNKYESELINLVNQGNYDAMIAVGAHLFENSDIDQSIDLLTKATEGGSSDAWYWLASKCHSKITISKMYKTGLLKGEPVELKDGEEEELNKKYYEYMYAGAKANKGYAAAKCQYDVAGYYYGEGGFPKDLNMAKYWLMMAQSNNANVDSMLQAVERQLNG